MHQLQILLVGFLLAVSSIPSANAETLGKERTFLVEVNSHPNYLKNKTVVIDPGHGGSDAGAIGAGGTLEKNITLQIAKELKAQLSAKGVKVILTREDDRDVFSPFGLAEQELKARVDIANKNRANLFISIHIDSFFNPQAGGTTTYYLPKSKSDVHAAHMVQDSLVSEIKLFDRGERSEDFYVLEKAAMPAVLTEIAFISNPLEERLMATPLFIKKAAAGLYSGIDKHFLWVYESNNKS